MSRKSLLITPAFGPETALCQSPTLSSRFHTENRNFIAAHEKCGLEPGEQLAPGCAFVFGREARLKRGNALAKVFVHAGAGLRQAELFGQAGEIAGFKVAPIAEPQHSDITRDS